MAYIRPWGSEKSGVDSARRRRQPVLHHHHHHNNNNNNNNNKGFIDKSSQGSFELFIMSTKSGCWIKPIYTASKIGK